MPEKGAGMLMSAPATKSLLCTARQSFLSPGLGFADKVGTERDDGFPLLFGLVPIGGANEESPTRVWGQVFGHETPKCNGLMCNTAIMLLLCA